MAEKKEDTKKEDAKTAKATETDAKAEAKAKPDTKSKAAKAKDKKAETISDLKELGDAVIDKGDKAASKQDSKDAKSQDDAKQGAENEPAERVKEVDKLGRSYGTGRRKNAIARVWIKPGKGKVIVNGKDQNEYFARQTQRLVLNQPFLIAERVQQFDVTCTVKGGGLSGQAGAVRHGIARALEKFEPGLRGSLKKAGMLTRDSRVVERKKVGKHKARRSKQWAKR